MRRRVLCGCWARLAFPRAREKKRKKAFGYLRVLLANNCCLPCPLIVTCESCDRTLCSWCDECDQCAEARKEVEYGIYGAQDY